MRKLLMIVLSVGLLLGCTDPHNSNCIPTPGTAQKGPINDVKFQCSQLATGQSHNIVQQRMVSLAVAGNPYAGLANLGQQGEYNKTYRRCMEFMGYTEQP